MPSLRQWELLLDVDGVIRGQGADPGMIRKRDHRLIELAERAIAEGRSLLDPFVAYRELKVESLKHERLALEGDGLLTGPLIAQHLAAAGHVVVMLCTIGNRLEDLTSKVMLEDPVYGLALDGLGSAAVESLANAACHYFETQAAREGFQVTIPLSPGMVGWSIEEGQSQIFALLNDEQVDVKLTRGSMMLPRKSLTMVLGLGEDVGIVGRTCDYCSMRETCRYREHYE